MSIKKIDSWFRNLDTNALAFIFPSLFEKTMASADPDRCTVNDFIKEAKKEWNELGNEQKRELYNENVEFFS